ncbi:SpoIIE family protein phosphatase [Antrihabitans spumae]|uniref:SpoIIE family protein phosphatase n=1 Tax=Antrihabitans spumae TaxID=3373370 RepID=A0ABW7K630_9NOCA
MANSSEFFRTHDSWLPGFGCRPGDTLVLYSDGLTEAQTGVGQSRYDDDGALLKFAAANSPSNAATIVDAIRTLLDGFGSGLQDDTAVLALGIPDVSA